MCGRFMAGLPKPGSPIGDELAAFVSDCHDASRLKTAGEIFPSDTVPIVTGEGDSKAAKAAGSKSAAPKAIGAKAMTWGFPGYPQAPGKPSRLLVNARAETAHSLKTWKKALASRRCLVPAAGFFEWSRPEKGKRKYIFRLEDSDCLLMAGLWGEFGSEQRFSILTTAAEGLIAEIHDRMPVIVRDSEMGEWLFGDYRALFSHIPPPLAIAEAK